MTPANPDALRTALRQQEAQLTHCVLTLSAAAEFPPRLGAADWRGEAAEACERWEQQLRHGLRMADSAVASARRSTRTALAELGA